MWGTFALTERMEKCWQRSGIRILEERPNMKRTRVVAEATQPGKPIQGTSLAAQQEGEFPIESDLSPERIVDGASATTAVLNQILAQREAHHQVRDWGINE
jgi:hypothetical protein